MTKIDNHAVSKCLSTTEQALKLIADLEFPEADRETILPQLREGLQALDGELNAISAREAKRRARRAARQPVTPS